MYIGEISKDAFTRIISTKNRKNEYKVETRRFANQKHLDNWWALITIKGVKILGIFETKDTIEHVTNAPISDEQFIEIATLEYSNDFTKTNGIQNYAIVRTDKGDYIQFLVDSTVGYQIIMHRNNEFTKWSFDRMQQSFINFVKIEKYLQTLI